ncbi:hypothetical protein FGE12_07300 [Aggregicoccus sp. 17bor-14]|uniref:RHS repeat domain-containing protein n=1 Tax=Myxococcaceae TaxID=31 RepID=UPI00129C51F0|nr:MULTISPECIES: RHS repeat protein [Myxococcaceae]MBF5042198.1 RHS repeat protein [Simulacricoccus sp. 17bor-14]MRI87974.1 hypothetical protein [Aggregicoccus sp. 17bor-14]
MGRGLGWGLGVVLALGGLGCGEDRTRGPEAEPPVVPAPGTPGVVTPTEPVTPPAPPGEPAQQCLGDAIVAATPAVADPLPCTETRLDADGTELRRTVRRYDAAGRLLERQEYDAHGEVLAFDRFGYDANGRVTSKETDRDGREQYAYDACGRRVLLERWNDSGWQRSEYVYDEAGRVSSTVNSVGDASNAVDMVQRIQLAYDAAGHLVRRTTRWEHAGHSSEQVEMLRYDASGQLLEESSTFARDGVVEPGETRRYTYDAAGRRKRVEVSIDGRLSAVEYTYDAAGHLLREQTSQQGSAVGRLELYTYDAQGRMTEHFTGSHENGTLELPADQHRTWSYAADGSVTLDTHYGWGPEASSTRDAEGREVAWSTSDYVAASFTHGNRSYGPRGELLREESHWESSGPSSTVVEERSYDAAGRLVLIDWRRQLSRPEPQSVLHSEVRYRYDAAGSPLEIATWNLDAEPAVLLERTTYDDVCRAPGS